MARGLRRAPLHDHQAAAHAEARLAESAALRVYGMRAQRAVVGMLREQTEVLH